MQDSGEVLLRQLGPFIHIMCLLRVVQLALKICIQIFMLTAVNIFNCDVLDVFRVFVYLSFLYFLGF